MHAIAISSDGICGISQLKILCSCGINGLSTKLVKKIREYSSIILHCLFTQSLYHRANDWLTSKVIPVYKPEETQDPRNYRPISLTSVPCKFLEPILFSRLANS